MTWSLEEILNKVKRDFDLENNRFVSDQEIISYINDAIDAAETQIHTYSLDNWYFSTFIRKDIQAGQNGYTLPKNIYATKILGLTQRIEDREYDVALATGHDKFSFFSNRNVDRLRGDSDQVFTYLILNRDRMVVDANGNEVPEGYRIWLSPTPSETIIKGLTIYYIRNARRLQNLSDLCDIPEFVNLYIIPHVKNTISLKENYGNSSQFTEQLAMAEKRMQLTLENMIPGSDNLIEADLSFYEDDFDASNVRGYIGSSGSRGALSRLTLEDKLEEVPSDGGSVSESFVDKLKALVKAYALIGGSGISKDDLDTLTEGIIDRGVAYNSITINPTTHVMTITSNDGRSNTLSLPAPPNRGMNAGATAAQLARIVNLENFESHLRGQITIVSGAHFIQATSNSSIALRGLARIPKSTSTIRITVGANHQDYTGAELLAKSKIVVSNSVINSSNALVFPVPGDPTESYFFGIDSGGDWFGGASEIGPVNNISIVEHFIDLEDFARSSSVKKVPTAKLSVKDYALTGGRKISRAAGDLDAATNEEINDAVPHDGVTVSGNDLVFSSNSGESTSVTLPIPDEQSSSTELDAVSSLPDVTNYSVGTIINFNGDLYEAVAGTVDRHIYRGTIADRSGSFVGDDVFEWEESPGNIHVNLPKSVLGSSPPNRLFIEVHAQSTTRGDIYAETYVDRTVGGVGDTATTYRYLRGSGAAAVESTDAKIGGNFDVSFYSESSKINKVNVLSNTKKWAIDSRDDVKVAKEAVAGNLDRWPPSKISTSVITLSELNPIALQGNVGRWPNDKISLDLVRRSDIGHRVVFDETFPGMTLTTTTPDHRPAAPNYFSPTFDLDTAGNERGEFHISLELSITPASDVNMGFVRNKANQTAADRKRALSKTVFASDVSEEAVFVYQNTGALAGIQAISQTVYSGNTIVGHYRMLLVRNTNNQVGLYHWWEGQAGSTGATISAEARVSFTSSDSPITNRAKAESAIIAKSSVLPTAVQAAGTVIAANWLVQSLGTSWGYSARGTGNRELRVPNTTDFKMGLFFRSMIGNAIRHVIFLPFGAGGSFGPTGATVEKYLFFSGGTITPAMTPRLSYLKVRLILYRTGYQEVVLLGEGTEFSANSSVEVFGGGVYY